MPHDPANAPLDFARPGSAAAADDAMGEIAWWFTGGMSLLAWTGIALLLTSA